MNKLFYVLFLSAFPAICWAAPAPYMSCGYGDEKLALDLYKHNEAKLFRDQEAITGRVRVNLPRNGLSEATIVFSANPNSQGKFKTQSLTYPFVYFSLQITGPSEANAEYQLVGEAEIERSFFVCWKN